MNLEFQRLARVRARQLSRRRRWLRILAAALVTIAVVATGQLAARVLGSRRLAASSEAGLALPGQVAALYAEARGRVGAVEARAGIVRVAWGFLGLMSVDLRVTADTVIVVGDKEGGLGDIREGDDVVATYELRPDARRATRIELFRSWN
jgi:hypothetical protein